MTGNNEPIDLQGGATDRVGKRGNHLFFARNQLLLNSKGWVKRLSFKQASKQISFENGRGSGWISSKGGGDSEERGKLQR